MNGQGRKHLRRWRGPWRAGVSAALLAHLASPFAVAAESLDLERAVALALERNPGLKAVEERRAEVRGGVREARADAFPQLALTTSWSRSRNPSLLNSPDFEEFIDAFPGGSFEPGEQELKAVALSLSQPLFTWGKVPAAIDLARLVEEAVVAQIETARLETAFDAAEAFYRLQAERQALETIEIQRRARIESLGVVEARYELGDATRLELLQARASVEELIPLIHAAEGRAAVALIELRSVLGLATEAQIEIAGDEMELPPPPPANEALERALALRPEFADLDLQRRALGRQREVTRADGLPQVEMTGAYGHTARLFDNLEDDLFADWFVAVGLRWEFFDGGRRRGQMAQLESRREQLRWRIEDLISEIRAEVEQERVGYVTALARWRAAETSAEAAAEASRVAGESYEEGVALQADWLAAQEREVQAEVLRVQARFEAAIQRARLARALGLRPDRPWPPPPASSDAVLQEGTAP